MFQELRVFMAYASLALLGFIAFMAMVKEGHHSFYFSVIVAMLLILFPLASVVRDQIHVSDMRRIDKELGDEHIR